LVGGDIKVVGVDAHPKGWVAIVLHAGRFEAAQTYGNFELVLKEFPNVPAIAVDIPIGLPPSVTRACDSAARLLVGPRRSSVFSTPPRAALEASSFTEASARCFELTGVRLSQQSYALVARIREVDAVVSSADRVFEVHPEVCFRAMAGHALNSPKRAWAGMWGRLELLKHHGVELPIELGEAGAIPPVDLIDAAAAAWSASRIASKQALSVVKPETDDRGRAVSIWY
jgi:predicted RNase H-like nuclease